jgi:hypothetical protein
VAALLLWTIYKKRYALIAGFLITLAAACALTLLFDRRVWIEYSDLMRSTRLMLIPLPTLSSQVRFLVAPDAAWLQYLPTGAACAWAVWYFQTRRHHWNWSDHGQLVLLVSVMCAPYAWLTDEAVLLPAVLTGLYRAIILRRSLLPIVIFGTIALVEVLGNVPITSWYYTWTAPAWLAWYLFATYQGTAYRQGDEIGSLASKNLH